MPPERLAIPQTDIPKRPAKRARQDASPVVSIDRGAGLVWRGPDYPVLSAGVYTVRAVRYQGPEWVRSFRRWSVRLEFALVHESVSVSAFFNLGDDPNGYRVGRQSRFYKAWVIANGDLRINGAVSLREIANGLNKAGLTTTRGGTWTATQVLRTLAS
jgi:hypothetical protein